MYHEDIRRAQLMTIVDKFRQVWNNTQFVLYGKYFLYSRNLSLLQVLVKQEAEDPAITAYFKKSIVR